MSYDNDCTCSQHGDWCPEHPTCACGCEPHAHWKNVGECTTGRMECRGCPEYRPAKLRKHEELDDDAVDTLSHDMLKGKYRELAIHHIEELSWMHWQATRDAWLRGPGRTQDFMRLRGIKGEACVQCNGIGVKMYSSTATWRGGVGGAAMTRDVCDTCWGSGEKDKTWTNLRTIAQETERRVAERAVTVIADRAGANFATSRGSVEKIIEMLDQACRKRSVSFWDVAMFNSLANLLRTAIGVPTVAERDVIGRVRGRKDKKS